MLRRLVLLVALLSSSCTTIGHRYLLPPTMSPEQVQDTLWAIAKWDDVLEKPIAAASPETADWRIVQDVPSGFDCAPGHCIGFTHGSDDPDESRRHTIELLYTMPAGDRFRRSVEHELGHSVGLHHNIGAGVMRIDAPSTEFSAEDMAECRKIDKCW